MSEIRQLGHHRNDAQRQKQQHGLLLTATMQWRKKHAHAENSLSYITMDFIGFQAVLLANAEKSLNLPKKSLTNAVDCANMRI